MGYSLKKLERTINGYYKAQDDKIGIIDLEQRKFLGKGQVIDIEGDDEIQSKQNSYSDYMNKDHSQRNYHHTQNQSSKQNNRLRQHETLSKSVMDQNKPYNMLKSKKYNQNKSHQKISTSQDHSYRTLTGNFMNKKFFKQSLYRNDEDYLLEVYESNTNNNTSSVLNDIMKNIQIENPDFVLNHEKDLIDDDDSRDTKDRHKHNSSDQQECKYLSREVESGERNRRSNSNQRETNNYNQRETNNSRQRDRSYSHERERNYSRQRERSYSPKQYPQKQQYSHRIQDEKDQICYSTERSELYYDDNLSQKVNKRLHEKEEKTQSAQTSMYNCKVGTTLNQETSFKQDQISSIGNLNDCQYISYKDNHNQLDRQSPLSSTTKNSIQFISDNIFALPDICPSIKSEDIEWQLIQSKSDNIIIENAKNNNINQVFSYIPLPFNPNKIIIEINEDKPNLSEEEIIIDIDDYSCSDDDNNVQENRIIQNKKVGKKQPTKKNRRQMTLLQEKQKQLDDLKKLTVEDMQKQYEQLQESMMTKNMQKYLKNIK